MANYGPPGGAYPGPPQEPWSDRQPPDQYGQPSDPWGGQDEWGGAPSSVPPGGPGSPVSAGGYPEHGSPGYPTPGPPHSGYPDHGYGPPQQQPSGYQQMAHYELDRPPGPDQDWSAPGPGPAAKPSSSRLFVVILAALAVLVLTGAGIGVLLLGGDEPDPVVQSDTGSSASPTSPPVASAEPAATTPAPVSSTDARFVKAGQCVRNEGTDKKPRLAIIKCAPRAYEVVARYDGSTTGEADAKAKCAKVEDYTNFYYFNSELDELDFVLCLKLR